MREDLLQPFFQAPDRAGIFLDFDGTLSEIVEVPDDARPVVEVRELLTDLSNRYKVVAVVSGRSADQLVDWLGADVEIWGVHGAQRAVGGRVEFTDEAKPHQELIALVKREADTEVFRRGLTGAIVEDKRIAITLHFRAAEDVGRASSELQILAQELADRHGLVQVPGRMSFELRPPIEFSKATVLLDRSRDADLSAALFVGDDRVDLPAFDALDILREEGRYTVRVAVSSPEAPNELIDRADLVVEGPFGVVEVLRVLAAG